MMKTENHQFENQPKLMRMRQLTEYLALSKAYIYQKISEGSFPPGHMISPGIRAWETVSVNAWLDEKMGRG
jgi:predicted DNA-binding transcriptional regulator AlpA